MPRTPEIDNQVGTGELDTISNREMIKRGSFVFFLLMYRPDALVYRAICSRI